MIKKNTKELILLEAFKLFATKTYEQSSFTELEEKTGLTRGAVMYYYKTKDLLFMDVCDRFLIQESSVFEKLEARTSKVNSLKEFIHQYILIITELKEHMKQYDIKNYNKAFINITLQATHYYPSFELKAAKWQMLQIHLWKKMIEKAVQTNEIRNDIDCGLTAELFEDIHCGISYAGMIYPDGIDLDRLRKAYNLAYNLLTVNK
jgi:AcrR family transcriptional regulator